MKKSILLLLVSAFVFTGFKMASNVDVTSSAISWKGSKPLGSHLGDIKLLEGNMTMSDGKLTGGMFVIDMKSINTTDLQAGKGKEKLDGHLKSADFFDVDQYPTSKFVITKVEDKGSKIHVTGDLTIKDVTKSVTIPATLSTENGVTTFKSETFEINRVDYNVKYGSKSIFANLKDKFINDEMELSFSVKTKS